MKKGTKEFYELMDQFEKDVKKYAFQVGGLEREKRDSKTPKDVFYCNGNVNNLL